MRALEYSDFIVWVNNKSDQINIGRSIYFYCCFELLRVAKNRSLLVAFLLTHFLICFPELATYFIGYMERLN